MAEAARRMQRQEWFVDPRTPDRRMRVTWHPDEALAVVSLWHGGTCTATFRLPAPDTARLIGVLADGLADGWQAASPSSAPPGPFERLCRWLSRRNPTPAVLTLITGGK